MTASSTVLHAFVQRCQQRPHAIALVQDEHSLSYSQLLQRSMALAAILRNSGVAAGDVVGICTQRSIDTVAIMLACFQCKAAFLPIDQAYPDARINYTLTDASVDVLIVDSTTLTDAKRIVADLPIQLINLHELATPILAVPFASEQSGITALDACVMPEQTTLAYIMYTSGSTGQPKGVAISHRALHCYCSADADVYQLHRSDRTLQFSTLSFDISIEEIFPPLLTGGTVVLRPTQRSEAQNELSDIIQSYAISAIHLATGYWHEWVDLMMANNSQVPECVRLMVVTGEKVSVEHYRRWQSVCGHPTLWANAYGPTEATVSATVFIPPSGWQGKAMPIGKPLPGYTAVILNEKMQTVSQGSTGELYIGGPGLAEGYLNKPELSAGVFVQDPFNVRVGARLYKTGDLARLLPSGDIAYAGRIDHQMKVGSYRIEPGEIENTINQLAGVDDCIVVAAQFSSQRQLLAYVASSKTAMTPVLIADHLRKQLPAHMVPSQYVLLPRLPKTLNGKIDRDALPDASCAMPARIGHFKAAATDVEKKLSHVFCDVLGVSSVSVDDSFLSLGGDSLMAVRTIANIQQTLDVVVSTRDFFLLDTVALLAGHIEGYAVKKPVPPASPFFVNSRNRQLYCVTQQPFPEQLNGTGILVVPPLGNEQRRCQRPLRSLMYNLSRQGYTLLRFDWHGTGNSSGTTKDLNDLQPWREDVLDAAERLSGQCDQIHVVSMRFGALISSLTDWDSFAVGCHFLWDPVLDGALWLEQMDHLHQGILSDTYRYLFKRKPRGDEYYEMAGLVMRDELYQAIASLNISDSMAERFGVESTSNPVHLFQTDAIASPRPIGGSAVPANFVLHEVQEKNDWLDPRSTTIDMNINSTASLLADLLRSDTPRKLHPAGQGIG